MDSLVSIIGSMNDLTMHGAIKNASQSHTHSDLIPVVYNSNNYVTSDESWYTHQAITINPDIQQYIFNNHQNTPSSTGSHDDILDCVCDLLDTCLSQNSRCRYNAEEALKLIENFELVQLDHFCRAFVYFPDLLAKFIEHLSKNNSIIPEDDFTFMIARCIEHSSDEVFALESFDILIKYKPDMPIEIKLLPVKRSIDEELYERAKNNNIYDKYYESSINGTEYNYVHMDVVTSENKGKYTGFRDAYHCLLYGTRDHLQALIVRWDLWGEDCTTEAARDFFGLDKDCPLEIIKEKINNRCRIY